MILFRAVRRFFFLTGIAVVAKVRRLGVSHHATHAHLLFMLYPSRDGCPAGIGCDRCEDGIVRVFRVIPGCSEATEARPYFVPCDSCCDDAKSEAARVDALRQARHFHTLYHDAADEATVWKLRAEIQKGVLPRGWKRHPELEQMVCDYYGYEIAVDLLADNAGKFGFYVSLNGGEISNGSAYWPDIAACAAAEAVGGRLDSSLELPKGNNNAT